MSHQNWQKTVKLILLSYWPLEIQIQVEAIIWTVRDDTRKMVEFYCQNYQESSCTTKLTTEVTTKAHCCVEALTNICNNVFQMSSL